LVGPYCGEMLCDVLPRDARHMLLGRPWLFGNHVIHNGHANTYAFKYMSRNRSLTLLPPPKLLKSKLRKEVRKAHSWVKHECRQPLAKESLYFLYVW